MLNLLSEKRAAVLAAALLFIFLLLLTVQVRLPDSGARVQAGLLALLSPVARAGASGIEGLGSLWSGYVDLRDARSENERLRRDLADMRVEARRLRALARENRRLARLLSLQQGLTLKTVAARVVWLTLGGPFRTAILDRGWRAGVAVDDPVITPEGVVGRVTAVTGGLAKVQLVTDFSSGAAAVLQSSRVQGLAVGRQVNEMEMRYVSSHADVGPGDWVNTSGLDGIYPDGLRLGRVDEVLVGEGLEQRVRIATSVDFRTLEEVLVLVGGQAAPVFPRAGEAGR